MERNELSQHQLRVFEYVKAAGGKWVTANDIALGAKVAPRTARAHALALVKLGIFDQAEVFPAHRYRLSAFAAKRNRAYMTRLAEAAQVFAESA
jgi:DNA-binding IclR family transcriptional regulator